MPLATLLAGPFMSLFSNILDIENSIHVLDLFVLDGEKSIIDIVKNVFKNSKQILLEIDEGGELQGHIIK